MLQHLGFGGSAAEAGKADIASFTDPPADMTFARRRDEYQYRLDRMVELGLMTQDVADEYMNSGVGGYRNINDPNDPKQDSTWNRDIAFESNLVLRGMSHEGRNEDKYRQNPGLYSDMIGWREKMKHGMDLEDPWVGSLVHDYQHDSKTYLEDLKRVQSHGPSHPQYILDAKYTDALDAGDKIMSKFQDDERSPY